MKDFVVINGEEGGGQILRTALSLSLLQKQPFKLEKIRATRPKSGLQPQHFTCVQAAERISQADVTGKEVGSSIVEFSPSQTAAGNYTFDVSSVFRSAGSVNLVLQTLLLPLAFAPKKSEVTIKGGTHVPWSPCSAYIEKVFLPMLGKMGLKTKYNLHKAGYYPEGKGEIETVIKPVEKLAPLNLTERGKLLGIHVVIGISNLVESIALRQRKTVENIFKEAHLPASFEVTFLPSFGKGTFTFILAEFENTKAGFTALGELKKRAETVADEACQQLISFLKTRASADKFLADQLALPCALADGKSTYYTAEITKHLLTNICLIEKLLPVKFKVEGQEGSAGKIEVEGIGDRK